MAGCEACVTINNGDQITLKCIHPYGPCLKNQIQTLYIQSTSQEKPGMLNGVCEESTEYLNSVSKAEKLAAIRASKSRDRRTLRR